MSVKQAKDHKRRKYGDVLHPRLIRVIFREKSEYARLTTTHKDPSEESAGDEHSGTDRKHRNQRSANAEDQRYFQQLNSSQSVSEKSHHMRTDNHSQISN